LYNQKRINDIEMNEIKDCLLENYFIGWRSVEEYSKDTFIHELEDHLFRRLESDRKRIIPWLNDSMSLSGISILEIGCGTGSSTVALAEQGANVVAIDIDEGAIRVAKKRCSTYKVKAELSILNATDINNIYSGQRFDLIIFFASLEHMTIHERICAIKSAWDLLDKNGMLAIVETPNRLWYFDEHTSMLPFYHWLPDDLALLYSCKSESENFKNLYNNTTAENIENFLRRGRGMSFHEIELAIKSVNVLKIINCLSEYENKIFKIFIPKNDRKFKYILKSIFPNIYHGFFDKNLYLIIQKD
jgi:S-adenosylmethionine-dependent methyltransferase